MNRIGLSKKNYYNIRPSYLVGLLLVVSILAVYGQVRDFEFINFDDPIYVTENRYVQQGLTAETVVWAFSGATRETNYWVPLTWLSILLDYELYGMNPGAFHLTNVLFHMLNTLLLFVVLRQMTGRFWRSALVAALFALHPLHVESVAWVTERKDMLSAFFWMLTLWFYGWYVQRPVYSRYFLVLLFFIFGLMSKPMGVTLPFVLLLIDYWPLQRLQFSPGGPLEMENRKRIIGLVGEKIPLMLPVVLVSVMAFLTQSEGGAVKSLSDYPMDVRMANALAAYGKYIVKMFWPSRLSFYYPYPETLPFWQAALAAICLFTISGMAVKTAKRQPYILVGWLWYLGTLIPVSGLVVIGHYVMADRYTYIPLIGLFIIITWGGADCLWRLRRRVQWGAAALALAVLLALSITSWRQVGHWRNSVTLFRHAIEATENNLAAHINMGVALVSEGRFAEAAEYNLKALQIDPKHADGYHNLGFIRQQQGDTAEAFRYFKKALEIDSEHLNSYMSLGNLMASSGNSAEALQYFQTAMSINPKYAKAHFNMGTLLLGLGRQAEAAAHLREALKIDPVYAEAHHNLGIILFRQNRRDEALFHFREVVKILPDSTEARNNLFSYQAAAK